MEVLGLFDIPSWVQWLLVIVGLIVYYVVYMSWNHDTFKKMGIDGPPPTPVIGNMRMFLKEGVVKADKALYEKYGRVFGAYEASIPTLYIGDPKLLKEIMVKEFNSFVNRRDTFKASIDPEIADMLTQIRDDQWRFVRNTITPTFSGKKLRQMTPLINAAADRLMKNIEQKSMNDEDIDMKRFLGGYTMDVIASTAFGLDVDSQNNPDDPFIKHAKSFSDSKAIAFLIITQILFPFLSKLPRLLTWLGVSLTKDATRFFVKATESALVERRSNPGAHADFLGIMVSAEGSGDDVNKPEHDADMSSEWTRKVITETEVRSQAILFFLAGYDTTANTLCFLMYHLAIYPENCDKAMQEIDDKLGGELPNYDNVHDLQYLEMCIHETLRIFPIAPRIDRMANRDVTIGNIRIPKGMIVNIPVGAIQKDPEFWPDPETFIPERFTPEAKAKRDQFVYLPFGAGPRNCVGMRLAMLEQKIVVARILQKYRPIRSEKTEVPIKGSKLGNRVLELVLKFQKRN